MPTTMLAMTVTDWVVTVATVVLACATVVLALLTFRYTRHTDRIARHAREQVETIARLHREEREERRRLALHAVRLELEQIRDACKDKRPQPTPLPTHSWDTSRGEIASDEAIVNAVLSVYGNVSRCNALYDSRVADTPSRVAIDKYLPAWQEQAAKTYECACAALEHLNADQAGGDADKESA